jgi:hypothetical protein
LAIELGEAVMTAYRKLLIGLLFLWTQQAEGQGVYWSQDPPSTIQRASISGGMAMTVVGDSPGHFYTGIVFDSEGTMYGLDGLTVFRTSTDGSGRIDLGTFNATGTGLDVDLDPINGKIYWSTNNEIHRIDFDGSNYESILSFGTTTEGIALDPVQGKIYFTTEKNGADNDLIEVMNLDGTDRTTLWTLPIASGPQDIDIDLGRGRLYWTQTDLRRPVDEHGVYSASADGTGSTSMIFGPTNTAGIHYEPTEDTIFAFGVPSPGNIGPTLVRFDTDGGNVAPLIADVGVDVVRYVGFTPVPEPSSSVLIGASATAAVASQSRRKAFRARRLKSQK